MFKDTEKKFCLATELLRQGAYIRRPATNPESAPIYLSTAFNVADLDELQERYNSGGFCYNRNRNPNRTALMELVTHTEGAEDSIVCSSGMAAISTTLLALAKSGDHIIASQTLYGESLEFLRDILSGYGVTVSFFDPNHLEGLEQLFQTNTKLVYTETVSNPLIEVADIDYIAELAHRHNALLIVDNTFMTAWGFRALEHGADIVVNSLTKFANGHSDAVCGSSSGSKALISKIYALQVLLGTNADAFTCWLVQRGMRTMALRLEKQMNNAFALAQVLAQSPYVKQVNYPGLTTHPQHQLAQRMFGENYGGMLSIVLTDDRELLNKFLRKLDIAHYAMTLGGYRTTLSHPIMSSHYDLSAEEHARLGITWGLLRISVGIEDSNDLIKDFLQALEVYK